MVIWSRIVHVFAEYLCFTLLTAPVLFLCGLHLCGLHHQVDTCEVLPSPTVVAANPSGLYFFVIFLITLSTHLAVFFLTADVTLWFFVANLVCFALLSCPPHR